MLKLFLWVSLIVVLAVILSWGWAFAAASVGWKTAPALGYGLAVALVMGFDWVRRVVMD